MARNRRYYYPHKHTWDTTAEIGYIVPSFAKIVTQLDTWGGLQTSIARMSPMNKPTFGTMHWDSYFFYVKFSDIWGPEHGDADDFKQVFTAKDSSYTWPTHTVPPKGGTFLNIDNYFGVGMRETTQTGPSVSSLPRRCYNHVWNHFFRDERFQAEVNITSNNAPLQCNYKGQGFLNMIQNDIEQGSTVTINTAGSTVDIQDIQDAMKDQRYKKLKEKYGEEFEDVLRLHGVNIGHVDGPILVAKSTTQIGISEVLSTAEGTTTEVGEYAGHGIGIMRTKVPKRLYLEPGFLFGVTMLRPRLVIKNRIPYEWLITAPLDLYHKFEVGQKLRDVTNKELYSLVSDATRDTVVGYVDKYEHLRKTPDVVAGVYLDHETYDDYHMAWEDGTGTTSGGLAFQPVGNLTYNRLFQDTAQPAIFCHHRNNIGVNSIVPRGL